MGDETYRARLTAAMEARGETVRGLAEKMATRRGTTLENERGKLKSYRRGDTLPDPQTSETLVELLEEPALLRAEKNRQRLKSVNTEVVELRGMILGMRGTLERLESVVADLRKRQDGASPRRVARGSSREVPQ